jgi:DNA invertase Pin-like site-specific DNA recombinase
MKIRHYNDQLKAWRIRRSKMYAMYLQGYGYSEIGRKYGISRQRVARIISLFTSPSGELDPP